MGWEVVLRGSSLPRALHPNEALLVCGNPLIPCTLGARACAWRSELLKSELRPALHRGAVAPGWPLSCSAHTASLWMEEGTFLLPGDLLARKMTLQTQG